MWKSLNIHGWPSICLLGPKGNLIWKSTGEGHLEQFDMFLSASLDYYQQKKLLKDDPIPLFLEKNKTSSSSPLYFPGKISSSLRRKELFISDSGNHRIIVTDLEGNIKLSIGSGKKGFKDGNDFDQVEFDFPHGIEFDEQLDVLYIADTNNHAVRKINLNNKVVTTVAGTGKKSLTIQTNDGKSLEISLASPWDLQLDPNNRNHLYIAMAGSHQIWRLNFEKNLVECFSGSGRELNLNNKVNLKNAAFAQPSGLSFGKDSLLYIADSESSTVRCIDIINNSTSTLVGGSKIEPANLFSFGDVDDYGQNAKLQHPMAVKYISDGSILIADSYNHKIKSLSLSTNYVKTLVGSSEGFVDGIGEHAKLYEPSGICCLDSSTIYVADTNNSAIRKLDLNTNSLSTLKLSGFTTPVISTFCDSNTC